MNDGPRHKRPSREWRKNARGNQFRSQLHAIRGVQCENRYRGAAGLCASDDNRPLLNYFKHPRPAAEALSQVRRM
jgi:hypothetical protein